MGLGVSSKAGGTGMPLGAMLPLNNTDATYQKEGQTWTKSAFTDTDSGLPIYERTA